MLSSSAKIFVHTDHYPLKYLETQEFLTPKRISWLERISMFDFDIVPIRKNQTKLPTDYKDKN